jgi:thiol-disulfide isomerase/thioredoxin
LLGLLGVLGVLALLAALGSDAPESPPPLAAAEEDDEHFPAPPTTGVASPPLKVGDVLPPLRAVGWVNGAPPAPGAPGARVMVVDVWALWCQSCARTAPGLVRAYQKYSSRGVAFVSLTDVDRKTVVRMTQAHSVPWACGYAITPEHIAALGAGSGTVGPPGYEIDPTLYVVGPDGRVRWCDGRVRSQRFDPQEWERAVDAAIAKALESAEAPPKP